MTEAVILSVAVAAGLACPVHMWWSHRRGRKAGCCPPGRVAQGDGEVEVLRARQERLRALIASHEVSDSEVSDEARAAARE